MEEEKKQTEHDKENNIKIKNNKIKTKITSINTSIDELEGEIKKNTKNLNEKMKSERQEYLDMLEKVNKDRKNLLGNNSQQSHVIFMCNNTTCMSNDIHTEWKISTGVSDKLETLTKKAANK